MTMKKCSSFVCISALLLFLSSCFYTVGFNQDTLETIVSRSRPLITALEKFKEDNGEYPKELSELIPEYLPEIPRTGYKHHIGIGYVSAVVKSDKKSSDDIEYLYLKYKEQDPSKDLVNNGYRLLVITDPFSMLDDENIWQCLVYRSSYKYPSSRLETFKEMIGEWALVKRYSGSLFHQNDDEPWGIVHF